ENNDIYAKFVNSQGSGRDPPGATRENPADDDLTSFTGARHPETCDVDKGGKKKTKHNVSTHTENGQASRGFVPRDSVLEIKSKHNVLNNNVLVDSNVNKQFSEYIDFSKLDINGDSDINKHGEICIVPDFNVNSKTDSRVQGGRVDTRDQADFKNVMKAVDFDLSAMSSSHRADLSARASTVGNSDVLCINVCSNVIDTGVNSMTSELDIERIEKENRDHACSYKTHADSNFDKVSDPGSGPVQINCDKIAGNCVIDDEYVTAHVKVDEPFSFSIGRSVDDVKCDIITSSGGKNNILEISPIRTEHSGSSKGVPTVSEMADNGNRCNLGENELLILANMECEDTNCKVRDSTKENTCQKHARLRNTLITYLQVRETGKPTLCQAKTAVEHNFNIPA
ncbi:MAG: hypothetical protein GY702_28905, partial [Desulfobulbaceae bacterium]|nr:hypothetical protein [Desulfobulbaceae bacterium]